MTEPVVDVFNFPLREFFANAAVNEDGIINLYDGILTGNPFSVFLVKIYQVFPLGFQVKIYYFLPETSDIPPPPGLFSSSFCFLAR